MKYALILLTLTILAVNVQNTYSSLVEYDQCTNDDQCGTTKIPEFQCRDGECKCEEGKRFLIESKPDGSSAGCVPVKDSGCANDNDCKNLKDSKCVETKCSSSAFRNLQLSALFLSLFAVGILRF